jgi:hypothetical protein
MQSMTAILEHLEQCRINNFPISNRRWKFESHPHRHGHSGQRCQPRAKFCLQSMKTLLAAKRFRRLCIGADCQKRGLASDSLVRPPWGFKRLARDLLRVTGDGRYRFT